MNAVWMLIRSMSDTISSGGFSEAERVHLKLRLSAASRLAFCPCIPTQSSRASKRRPSRRRPPSSRRARNKGFALRVRRNRIAHAEHGAEIVEMALRRRALFQLDALPLRNERPRAHSPCAPLMKRGGGNVKLGSRMYRRLPAGMLRADGTNRLEAGGTKKIVG